jgi:hypothetical protein
VLKLFKNELCTYHSSSEATIFVTVEWCTIIGMFNTVTILLMHESGHSVGIFLNLNDNARKGRIPTCSFSGFRRLTAPVPVSLRGVSCAPSGGPAHSWGTLYLGHYVGTRRSPRHPDGRLPSSCRSWVSIVHKWTFTQRDIGPIPELPGSKHVSKGVLCCNSHKECERHSLLHPKFTNYLHLYDCFTNIEGC